MSFVEDYVRWWVKYEKEEFDILLEWVKSIRGILKFCIRYMKIKVCIIYFFVFSKLEVIKELDRLYEEYVLVLVDKVSNNIVFVCKVYYYNCILNEFGINFIFGNYIYILIVFLKDEIF